MTDYFALLNERRRPWLDSESLKGKFVALSTQTHPDRHYADAPAARGDDTAEFAELNAAFNCLRDPKDRLRHLLTLETGAKPKDLHEMPPDLVELFMKVGQFNRQIAEFLAERAKVKSAIMQVSFFEKAQSWTEQVVGLQKTIAARQDAVLQHVRTLDACWEAGEDHLPLLPELEQSWRLLSFLSRWSGQLQNAMVQLSL